MERISNLQPKAEIERDVEGIVVEILTTDRYRTASGPFQRYCEFQAGLSSSEQKLSKLEVGIPDELRNRARTFTVDMMNEYRGKLLFGRPIIGKADWYKNFDDTVETLDRLIVEAQGRIAAAEEARRPAATPAKHERPSDEEVARRRSSRIPPWFAEDGSLQLFIGGRGFSSKENLHWNPRCDRLRDAEIKEISAAQLLESQGSEWKIQSNFECCKQCQTPQPKYFGRQSAAAYKDAELRRWWSDRE